MPLQPRLWTITLLALTAALLVGCLPTAPATSRPVRTESRRSAADAAAAQPTTISWSFWGDPWETEINRRVARAFEAEHPSIKVDLIHRPWSEYFTWLEEQWRQGTAPDVMFLFNIRGYASRGLLAPIDDYLQRDRFDLSDFYPRLLDLYNYQGRYYGLPRDNDTKVVYYNKKLFAQAGVDPPAAGWTWTDLRNLANRLTRRDATGRITQYGFSFESIRWWQLWVWQNGGDVVDNPLSPTLVKLGERPAVEALEFLTELVNTDRVTPPPEILASSDKTTELFREGRLAMAFGNHTRVPVLAEEPALEWDVVGLPQRQQRANLAGGAGYTIWSGSQRQDAAWMLVRYLESEKGQALFAESGLIVPARRSIREDNIFLRQQPYNARVFTEETEFGRPNLNIPQAPEIDRLTIAAFEPMWQGRRTPDDIVGELVPQLRRLVERQGG